MELERQTLNLAPDRWILLYRDRVLGDVGNPDPDGVELEIDDLAELDRYMDAQERQFQDALKGTHTMSGAQVPPIDWTDQNQWGPWT